PDPDDGRRRADLDGLGSDHHAHRALSSVPHRGDGGDGRRDAPALASRRDDGRTRGVAVAARAGSRARHDDAGPRARGAERREYSVLGAATSGVTMMRGVGGSLGTAVFGAIFTSRLASELSGGSARLTGAQVARLPPAPRHAYEEAYVHALHPVFIVAAGVAAAGFALSWL